MSTNEDKKAEMRKEMIEKGELNIFGFSKKLEKAKENVK